MDFKSYLEESAEQIDQKLKEYLEKEVEESKKVSPKLTHLVKLFACQSEGGKRLRGTLVRLGYELFSPIPNPEIYQAALAYEVVQTALLAHDDIIDRSDKRRGVPTMYQSLGGEHYGISQTIILGDIGIFLSFRLILNSNFAEDIKLRALDYFNQSLLKTGGGEMLDIEIPAKGGLFSEEEVITISHLKTAHYTIIGPLQLGASLAGAEKKDLAILEEFGKYLGIAFQIQDDILGIFGEEEETGKSITSDIEEGKVTLLYLEALRSASPLQKEQLKKLYGKGGLGREEVEKVREIFRETGSLDLARKKAVEYVQSAKDQIKKIAKNEEQKELLHQLADFLIIRNS